LLEAAVDGLKVCGWAADQSGPNSNGDIYSICKHVPL